MLMISFESVPRSPYNAVPPDQLMTEIADVRTVAVTSLSKVGYTLLNRDRIGEAAPIVAIGGFLSDVTTPDRAWEGVQLAALDRPVLMLDLPGHGLTSPHNRKQIYDLCIRRDPNSEARPLTEAVQRLLSPNDHLDFFGISHGALMSLKVTEQDPADRVDHVLGIDIPAVKKRPTLGLQVGYMVLDTIIGRKAYLQELAGTGFIEDFEAFKAAHNGLGVEKADSFVSNNTGLFLLNLFCSINARPVALDSWKAIMDSKTTRVDAITAGNSHVSNAGAIDIFIQSLPADQQERSHQVVIPGENHNIGIVHLMPRAARWARNSFSQK